MLIIRSNQLTDFISFLKEHLSSVRDTITDPSHCKGILHADLFADNGKKAILCFTASPSNSTVSVMFKDDEVSGIIDFEEVCIGPVLLDVGMVYLQPFLSCQSHKLFKDVGGVLLQLCEQSNRRATHESRFARI